MQTSFNAVQLADPTIARADEILRRCVHCGLCTATCPTYVLTGDERDSPRGRIYFMKQMFEEREVTPSMTYHIDRCLSCFACMTTCPSGVDYMHLVDLARVRIEAKGHRTPAPAHAALDHQQGAAQSAPLPAGAELGLAGAAVPRVDRQGWLRAPRRRARSRCRANW